jgi:Spy/CpxP family protein refolding chaperone
MTKQLWIITLAIILSVTAAFAQGKKTHGDHGKGIKEGQKESQMMQGCPRMGGLNIVALKQQLNLSDEQVNKISVLQIEHKKTMLKYREELAPKEIKLERLLLEDAVNLDEVKALVMDISKIKGEMKITKIMKMLEIEKLLTPEQRIKFKVMHQHQRPMRGGEKMKMMK